jgi:hypothetical protein
MDTHEQQPPCAADALYGIRSITVRGRSVGVARLCDAITDVLARRLTSEEEIKAALLDCVSRHNYVPAALRAEYAQALLAEYYATECRCGG